MRRRLRRTGAGLGIRAFRGRTDVTGGCGARAEQDVTLASFEDWRAYAGAHPRVCDPAAQDAIGARILANGFREPLTGRRAEPAQIARGPDWREGLAAFGLNARQRSVLKLLDAMRAGRDAHELRIFAAEALTPLALVLRGCFARFLGAEYAATPAIRDWLYPIPHEDLTRLSLASDTFDVVTTNEVLEHVPDIDAALREIARVLVPGGWHVGTVPFAWTMPTGIVRAVLREGRVEHRMEPEFHGNPMDAAAGSLVYEIPGWDLLPRAREAGFRTAHIRLLTSEHHGYLDSFVFCARK